MFRQLISIRKPVARAAASAIVSRPTQFQSLTQIATLSSWKSSFERLRLQAEAQELNQRLKTDSSPRAQLQYIRTLSQYDPKAAQTTIQQWWEAGVPVTDEMMVEFTKALVATKDINQLGFRQLAEFYNSKVVGVKGAGGATGVDVAALLARQAPQQGFSGAGSSPMEPLYIAYKGSDWKSQMWKLGRHGITLFILVALLGTFLDEKGKK